MQQNVGNAKRMHMYADALNVCAGPYGAVALSSTVPPPGEREIISTKITGSEPTILYLITMGVATRWWKNFEEMFIRFDMIQTDGRTDGHRMPAIAALMHSIARQK